MISTKKIGVTGGIGSGKSLICKIFSHLGIPIYDSDQRARWLMNNDAAIRSKIIEVFGEESYNANNQLNRDYMAQSIFNDQSKLTELNQIVHPRVGEDFNNWVSSQSDAKYCIKEAALLFESGAYKELDLVINITAPIPIRVKRIVQRDPFRSEKEILAIIDKQMSEEERSARSGAIIFNDDHRMVIPQVLKLHQRILSL